MPAHLDDLRSGLRILTRSPGPAAVAVAVLALGIGLAAAMFAIVDGTVFNELPIEDGHEWMAIDEITPSGVRPGVPMADYLDWREQQTSFEHLAAWEWRAVHLGDGEQAARLRGAAISASAFPQLRVRPVLGSLFGESHDRPGAEPVVLLSHRVWQERYGGDPAPVAAALDSPASKSRVWKFVNCVMRSSRSVTPAASSAAIP